MEPQGPWHITKIGIALAAYQPDPIYFEQQLKSIQDQTFSNWNCWITLDSPLSDLKNLPILKPFFEDPRFIWSQNPSRLGHKKNFEHAMNLAAADPAVDAIACSDQDDIWYPEKLGVSAGELEKRGRLSLVHCDMHILTENKTINTETAWIIENRGIYNNSTESLIIRNLVAGCAMLIDANIVRRWRQIPNDFEYHDHWYAVIASTLGGAHPIEKPLYAYRQHSSNVVGVSPFKGVLHLTNEERSFELILQKTRTAALKTTAQSEACRKQLLLKKGALPASKWKRTFRFLALYCTYHSSDKPFARACLARAIGTALSPPITQIVS